MKIWYEAGIFSPIIEDLKFLYGDAAPIYEFNKELDEIEPEDFYLLSFINPIWINQQSENQNPPIFTNEYVERLKRFQLRGINVIVDYTMEGTVYCEGLVEYLNRIGIGNIKTSKIILATNNSKTRTFGYEGTPVKMIYFPHFFISTLYKFKPYITNTDVNVTHDFLCLNRRMRKGKYRLLLELERRNLLDNTLWTWIGRTSRNHFPETSTLKRKALPNDVEYNGEKYLDDSNTLYGLNTDWYNKVKVDIVNETYYYEESECHMTEKVFKPMMMGKPFVVNSTKGYIDELRKLGFKYPEVEYDSSTNLHRTEKVVDSAIELINQDMKYYNEYNKELFNNVEHKIKVVEAVFLSKLNSTEYSLI